MILSVTHDSHYLYETTVSLSQHLIYLRPRENASQRLRRFDLTVSPDAVLSNVIDPLDNDLIQAFFPKESDRIDISTAFEIETLNTNPFNFVLKDYAINFPFVCEPAFGFALAPYLIPPFSDTQVKISTWLADNFSDRPKDTTEFISALLQLLFTRLNYRRREELGIQTSIETLNYASGTCRDYAVLFVEICRLLKLAARFVSGYLYTPAGEDDLADNAMHAWAEVYLPGAGWKAVDPTHGVWCDDCYVPVAHGAQAQSINPVQGAYFSPKSIASTLKSSVTVTRID
jgi:transglutaminase-like putative cysteine protease